MLGGGKVRLFRGGVDRAPATSTSGTDMMGANTAVAVVEETLIVNNPPDPAWE